MQIMENFKDYSNKIINELNFLNDDINNINNNLNELNNIMIKIKNYENILYKIKTNTKMIETSLDNIKIIYDNKVFNMKHKLNKLPYIDNEECVDNSDISYEYKNITNNENFKNKDYTKCPVINISEKNKKFIINTPIYHINETDEYCIKINNKIISGNISNIISEKDKKNYKKIKKCNQICCNNKYYDNKECKFYHKNEIRNFTNYSWKHITNNKLGKIKIKNKNIIFNNYDKENTRFVGSLDTLSNDIIFTNKYEKELREKQLVHDILIYQIIDQYLN